MDTNEAFELARKVRELAEALRDDRVVFARHLSESEQTEGILLEVRRENVDLKGQIAKLKAQLDKLSRFPGSEPGFVVGARVLHKASTFVGVLRSGSSINNIPTWRVECRVPSYDHGRRPDDSVVYGEWPESELVVIDTER